MALTYDTANTANNGISGATTATVSHTVTNDGPSAILLACITWNGNGKTLNSVTYNSVTMTQLAIENTNASICTAIYYLVNPTRGSSQTCQSNFSTTTGAQMTTISFSGGNSSQNGGTATNVNASALLISATVTLKGASSFIVDCVGYASSFAVTANSGQTARGNANFLNNTLMGGASTMLVGTPDVKTTGWNQGTFTGAWSYCTAEIKQVKTNPALSKTRPRSFAPGIAR